MSISREYKQSLKMADAEEILDLFIFRPLAFLLVKIITKLPITPNQVTYSSLVAGLIAAYEFGQGNVHGFVLGTIWYAIANVLDCSDGMLARLQKSGTPLGRIVDGVVDWISSVAIFFGLGWGMSAYFLNPLYWFLSIAAGIVSGYHAMMFDKRQQEYISTVRGERNFIDREEEKVEVELAKSSGLRKVFLSVYSRYMGVQKANGRNEESRIQYPVEAYRHHNKSIMRWWTWLGPTTNRAILMIAALLSHPEWFCWFVLIPLNLYLVFLMTWQSRINERLAHEYRVTSFQAAKAAA